jgi:DNA-binding NtrC family response regulator
MATQSKLLRAIESRRIRPVGSEREAPVDLRFIFATNADLEAEVEAGRFRADLFYRINVMHIEMPPLAARGDDVLELAELFMTKLSKQLGVREVPMDAAVRAGLTRYDWPGNVRELRNLIERTLILGKFPAEFRDEHADQGSQTERDETLDEMERRHILAMLHKTSGNRNEAARRLGVSRKTIDRKCASWEQE